MKTETQVLIFFACLFLLFLCGMAFSMFLGRCIIRYSVPDWIPIVVTITGIIIAGLGFTSSMHANQIQKEEARKQHEERMGKIMSNK